MDKKGLAKSIEPFWEKVESLSKTQRILISSVFFILIVGTFVYFFYWPKFEKIASLKTELTKLEKKLATAKRNAADLKKFQAKMTLLSNCNELQYPELYKFEKRMYQ